MTRFVTTFAVLLLALVPAAAFAQTYGYTQAYDAQGHYLRVPANYQPAATYQPTVAYQRVETSPGYAYAGQPSSMYPTDSGYQAPVVATAAPVDSSTTFVTTTTTTRPSTSALAMAPLTVESESDTTRLLPPVAAMPTLASTAPAATNVMMRSPCYDGNHRAHNKGINTSTTVSGDCLD